MDSGQTELNLRNKNEERKTIMLWVSDDRHRLGSQLSYLQTKICNNTKRPSEQLSSK